MVGPAFVAAVQAAAAGQPGDGPLHDPAVPAQALAGLDPAAGEARDDAPTAEEGAQVGIVITLVAVELCRPSAAGPRRERIGGIPRTSGSKAWLSWVLAAPIPTEIGRPLRSMIMWIFEPLLPRSSRFRAVRSPLLPLAR
ncbi:hypothetical protein Mco01_77790 [Microbispora corallina]|uniref:Uncharacterized protein n=1 Tax=Microbispora corallina TaxID=83302 RepID=A0ABQ4GCH9_9ACTN|nr:hypothetical protein Mco01_77790 [Microbispora corallina]